MIKNILQYAAFMTASVLISHQSQAETVYVIDNIKVGIHQEASIDSPVIQLIPTGSKLNVIERAGDLVQIETEEGVKGWVGLKYVMDEVPARTIVDQVRAESEKIKAELEKAKQQLKTLAQSSNTTAKTGNSTEKQQLQTQNKELNNQLNAERLKVGQLQAELTELRKRLGQGHDADALYQQIEQLENTNRNLQAQLRNMDENKDTATGGATLPSITTLNWRSLAAFLAGTLVIGMILGIALLDYFNRKRHGGFRI